MKSNPSKNSHGGQVGQVIPLLLPTPREEGVVRITIGNRSDQSDQIDHSVGLPAPKDTAHFYRELYNHYAGVEESRPRINGNQVKKIKGLALKDE